MTKNLYRIKMALAMDIWKEGKYKDKEYYVDMYTDEIQSYRDSRSESRQRIKNLTEDYKDMSEVMEELGCGEINITCHNKDELSEYPDWVQAMFRERIDVLTGAVESYYLNIKNRVIKYREGVPAEERNIERLYKREEDSKALLNDVQSVADKDWKKFHNNVMDGKYKFSKEDW